MSEADYMDDCQMVDLWDDQNKPEETHEVVRGGSVVFRGSRAACWDFKRHNGGWVQGEQQ
jgi:hypothetical protein